MGNVPEGREKNIKINAGTGEVHSRGLLGSPGGTLLGKPRRRWEVSMKCVFKECYEGCGLD
jgi:hypothetical protein